MKYQFRVEIEFALSANCPRRFIQCLDFDLACETSRVTETQQTHCSPGLHELFSKHIKSSRGPLAAIRRTRCQSRAELPMYRYSPTQLTS